MARGPKPTRHPWDGEMLTAREIAAREGVCRQRAFQMIAEGRTGRRHPGNWRRCHFDGRDWPSLIALARHYGVTAKTARLWLDNGLTAPPPRNRKGPYEFSGGPFGTLQEMADHHSVTLHTAWKWIRQGLTEPPVGRPVKWNKGPYEFGGGTFQTQREIAAAHGVSEALVSAWLKAGLTEPPAKYRRD